MAIKRSKQIGEPGNSTGGEGRKGEGGQFPNRKKDKQQREFTARFLFTWERTKANDDSWKKDKERGALASGSRNQKEEGE